MIIISIHWAVSRPFQSLETIPLITPFILKFKSPFLYEFFLHKRKSFNDLHCPKKSEKFHAITLSAQYEAFIPRHEQFYITMKLFLFWKEILLHFTLRYETLHAFLLHCPEATACTFGSSHAARKYPLCDGHYKYCFIFGGFLCVIYVFIPGLHKICWEVTSATNIPVMQTEIMCKNPPTMKQYLLCPSHKGYLQAAWEKPNVKGGLFWQCIEQTRAFFLLK
jgi:hypothetical protein